MQFPASCQSKWAFQLVPGTSREWRARRKEQDVQFDIAVQAAHVFVEGGAPRLTVPVDSGKHKDAGGSLSRVRFEVQVRHAVGDGRKGVYEDRFAQIYEIYSTASDIDEIILQS